MATLVRATTSSSERVRHNSFKPPIKMSGPKPCDGPAVKLSPVRFADLAAKKPDTAAPAADAAPAKKPAYVPPSARKAEAAKPKLTLSSEELKPAEAFPTLGPNWTQLRARFTPAAAAASPTAASTNAFAALDEDAVSVSTGAPLDFKATLHERIRRDEEEARLAEIPETEDPLEMDAEQLKREGWAALPRPVQGTAAYAEQMSALAERLQKPDTTMDDPFGLKQRPDDVFTWENFAKSTYAFQNPDQYTPHQFFSTVLGPGYSGEDLTQKYKPRAPEEFRTSSRNVAPSWLQTLMERKRAFAAQKAAAAC